MTKLDLPVEPVPAPFKGFLLAAYKSIAKNIRSHRITRVILFASLLVLVVIPPVVILSAFFTRPAQTARFFSFRIASEPYPQILGVSTTAGDPQILGATVNDTNANQNKGSVLGAYVSALLEPQAAAAIKALRAVNPDLVSDIILPSEESKQVIEPNFSIAGPPGPQGPPGPAGVDGGVSKLTTGYGLSGKITGGELKMDLFLTAFGATKTNTSSSGLEITSSGLSLLRGCDNSQVLVWNSTINSWQCAPYPTEADTLSSVTERGAWTDSTLTLNGGITNTMPAGLKINSSTGNITITVGGSNSSGKVQIGGSSTATPDVFVLDQGTTDPAGINGGMYYNTTSNKFRCYEGNIWKNCINP